MTSVLTPCIDCGAPSPERYCEVHRPRDSKPSARARGYDTQWDAVSRRARKLQPFCLDCGAEDDLQADHTPEAWRRRAAGKSIRLEDVAVVCGPCNRARGTARPGGKGSRGDRPDPTARQSLRHTPDNHSQQIGAGS